MGAIADATMERWFSDDFREKRPDRVSQMRAMLLRNDVAGYSNCARAVSDADFQAELGKIPVETLVVTGDEDPVTNVEQATFLQTNIPGAQLKILPARHLSGAELPEQFAETLLDFLVGHDTYTRGMQVRRTVLGDAHVDKTNASITEFNADFQQFITNYAWGEIWTRPGLAKRERSLITLAMLIALNRKAEFQMHVRAALHNGVTVEEIREVILQSGIYCGLPAANEAIHAATEILDTWKK
jgi:3-oxoadipate enol-lactonase/4-carboxymuconolactone decarboxylase